jgi:tetratricopeptide (TPR) repeat protein
MRQIVPLAAGCVLLVGVMGPWAAGVPADEPAKAATAPKPPWQRLLQGEDARRAAELEAQLLKLTESGELAGALKVAEDLEALRVKLQGADHYDTVNIRWYADALRQVMKQGKEAQADYASVAALKRRADDAKAKGQYAQEEPLREKVLAIYRKALGEEHPTTADAYLTLGFCQTLRGKYAEAEAGLRKGLAVRRKTLGEEHPDTAQSHTGLAFNLYSQGKYAEAEASLRQSLSIRRRVLGEDHPDTADAYNDLAYNLYEQGKYAEAEEGSKKALAVRRKTLGEDHPSTANSYTSLAFNQYAQGKYAEAEVGFRTALAIYRKALGEEHPYTARLYNNLAANLTAQGKHAEAEGAFRTALAVRRKSLGEDHADTAQAYSNLAANQSAQGKYAEAEAGLTKALAIYRKVLGEESPQIAVAYNNLANVFHEQGKHAEAEAGHKKALAIRRKALGEEHPSTAQTYNNLANAQRVQGKYAEAQEGLRKALAIRRKALGEEHPLTAQSYSSLAANQNAQGKYDEAEALWALAAGRFGTARLRVARSGLDRAAATGKDSPLPFLAAVLARTGKPSDAWSRFEEGLARGTWDDLSARLRRPADEQARQAELVARLERLDRLVESAATAGEATPEQNRRRDDLMTQRRQAQDQLDAFARGLEQKYGPVAGRVFDRKDIQASLPADAALVGWVDLAGAPTAADPDGEHWAFLLRAAGEPVMVRLAGTGPEGHWTDADTKLAGQLRAALQSPSGDWRPLADRLRRQRLGPLAGHLAARDGLPAVRRLIVLPSAALAGVPAEAFAEGYTVGYALSGTLYAHLRKQPKAHSAGLLALADPVFDRPAAAEPPAPPMPPGGLLVTSVVAGGNAAQAGLKAGDVLLRYDGADLAGPSGFKALPESEDADRRVAVTVWRDGATRERQLRPGKLGVVFAREPAPQALAARYEADRWLAKSRGGEDGPWDPLPGTRVEAEGLRRLFSGPGPEPLVLADSDASEQRLYDLAKSGELGRYRYLHLATHGAVDDRFPLRSAVILSRDTLPDPDRQPDADRPVFDGRLTAEEVLRQWRLDADLVTLSACQTALGKYERGEGFVGFAQALLLAGSRSVCLSLWKVDDTATALLMNRFYENLLGKREGLNGPMGKAEALAEAKVWLRGLGREEAARRAAALGDGVARGKRPKLPPAAVPEGKPSGAANAGGGRPYAHPYYWAAFILIGDPD